jgi:hypothetical protein
MANRKIPVPHGNWVPAAQPEVSNFAQLSQLPHTARQRGKSNVTRKFYGSAATVNIRSYCLSGAFQYLPLFSPFLPPLIPHFQIYIPLERRFDPWSPPSAGHNDCLHHWIVIRFLYFSKWQAGWAKTFPPSCIGCAQKGNEYNSRAAFLLFDRTSYPSLVQGSSIGTLVVRLKKSQTARECSIRRLRTFSKKEDWSQSTSWLSVNI